MYVGCCRAVRSGQYRIITGAECSISHCTTMLGAYRNPLPRAKVAISGIICECCCVQRNTVIFVLKNVGRLSRVPVQIVCLNPRRKVLCAMSIRLSQ